MKHYELVEWRFGYWHPVGLLIGGTSEEDGWSTVYVLYGRKLRTELRGLIWRYQLREVPPLPECLT